MEKKATCLWLYSHWHRLQLHMAGSNALLARFSFLLFWWAFPGPPSQAAAKILRYLETWSGFYYSMQQLSTSYHHHHRQIW